MAACCPFGRWTRCWGCTIWQATHCRTRGVARRAVTRLSVFCGSLPLGGLPDIQTSMTPGVSRVILSCARLWAVARSMD